MNKSKNIHPKVSDHPLISSGPLSRLYKNLVKCNACPRIVDFRTRVAKEKRKQYQDWTYWGKPIPGYGDVSAKLLILGLAPAAHGGNRTGRVFTGDKSADFLIKCLHQLHITNQSNSDSLADGLIMHNAFMTPVLKCVPPFDKPTAAELKQCSDYFVDEMHILSNVKVVLALGKIGFDGYLRYIKQNFNIILKDYPFGHDEKYNLPNGKILWGCYHPSPRNVNTGRLNEIMMIDLLKKVKGYIV
ncbi:MAG: uracil-DNA glycosylase [Candidatus Marinimicrobia bacterium]|nr:uracil-DNA glycosylase [Candidatus Neomarinimicrobiota bacterium]|tara:strand:- start:2696 stop:3427 length:732 start_codon:yes stop_codon:yes gene_type:complete